MRSTSNRCKASQNEVKADQREVYRFILSSIAPYTGLYPTVIEKLSQDTHQRRNTNK